MRLSANTVDARVRFPLFGAWAAAHARGEFGPEFRGVRFSLWARIPLVTPRGIFLDPAAAGRDELVLQLPPTGSVVVTAPESQSEPLHFALRHLPQGPLSTHPAMQLFAEQPITAGGLGGARFERVGLDTTLQARAARVAGSAFVTDNASGPQAVGEEVTIGLELPPIWARIRGRLRTPQGAPVANSSLQLLVAGSSPVDDVLYQHSLSTNKYGQFMALIDSYGELRSTRHEELRSARSIWIHSKQTEEMLVAHVELERQLDRGMHSLSVVALEPAPILASGDVRNAAGSPVAGARIFLSAVARPLRSFERTLIEGSRFSDEQGRFDLRGFTTGETVEVRAEHSM